MTLFELKVYANGQQATIPQEIIRKETICEGDYVTIKIYHKKFRDDYAIITAKVSKRGIITLPSWAVKALWIQPKDTLKAEIVKVYKLGGDEDGGTQPDPTHIRVPPGEATV